MARVLGTPNDVFYVPEGAKNYSKIRQDLCLTFGPHLASFWYRFGSMWDSWAPSGSPGALKSVYKSLLLGEGFHSGTFLAL